VDVYLLIFLLTVVIMYGHVRKSEMKHKAIGKLAAHCLVTDKNKQGALWNG
jgi:hypothetical protein